MKAHQFHSKPHLKTQTTTHFTLKKSSTQELVNNFITALNTNSGLSKKYSSQASTTISDRDGSEQSGSKKIQLKRGSNNREKSLLAEYQCNQKFQNHKKPLVYSTMYEFRKEIQKSRIDPIYFVKHQGIRTVSRAILMDWITQLCSEFGFRRQTCQLSKILIDAYLSATSKIPLKLLQLVGVSCLLISSKIQESLPKSLVQMACATACLYNVEQIKQFQIEILTKLKFRIRFLTYDQCTNHIIKQWSKFKSSSIDLFQFTLGEEEPLLELLEQNLRSMLDVITLDSQSLNYNILILALSVFVILVGYNHGWLFPAEIQYSLIYNSLYFLTSTSYFLHKISEFLNLLETELRDLSCCIKYICSYFFLIETGEQKTELQRHNPESLRYLKMRKQFIESIEMIFQ